MRFVKKNNIRLARGTSYHKINPSEKHCVLGVVAHITNHLNVKWSNDVILGLDTRDRHCLEAGFEDWGEYKVLTPKNRVYYNVGQNFYKLARKAGMI